MGTTLAAPDSLNERPISLFGFGWDYGGTTSSYNGGRLDSLWRLGSSGGSAVHLRLAPDWSAPQSLRSQVAGDRVYRSDDPAMRALNPHVFQILVYPRSCAGHKCQSGIGRRKSSPGRQDCRKQRSR
jgi:hypothetical protein